jgi:DNA-binding NtrC family response regulator
MGSILNRYNQKNHVRNWIMEQIKILVVDDEFAVCDIFYKFLTPLGYKVRTAHEVDQALTEFKSLSPHFVFLDVIIPGESGIQILQKMLEIDQSSNIVMISGMHDLTVAKEAMMLGAVDYITKPIEFENLHQYIQDQAKEMFGI